MDLIVEKPQTIYRNEEVHGVDEKMLVSDIKELIEQNLQQDLEPVDYDKIPMMLSEIYLTRVENIPRLTLKPFEGDIAMQYSCYDGTFLELTSWEYIQTVGTLVSDETNVDYEPASNEIIAQVLNHYLKDEYKILADFTLVIDNRRELTVNDRVVYAYDCPMQTIYLTTENYPVTYGKQLVKDEKYYYNFSNSNADATEIDLFTYIAPYEWKRNSIFD